MLNLYTVKYKNFDIGIINMNTYRFYLNIHCNPKFIPRELLNPTKENVINFLKSRVVQEDNQGLGLILEDLGIQNYNIKQLIDKTKGMDLNDCIWITNNPKENYYKVHIRENHEKYFKNIKLGDGGY